ncbi:glycosyltransferase [Methanobacterium sp. SMA-27]|uniref:glycosyltransferase n=1 Tax=Methanobacterium sp. SMA-27 TaxID=1495336 RepID=UPI00064EDC99|nr:glycosyltransferase [Methanobacterium sp. SMA-27]
MRLLVVQESDWIKRNPHQQHHLMERLSMRGHEIRVIDYPIDWKEEEGHYKKREVVEGYHKIHQLANVKVIRPSILKIPLLVYPSIIFSHRKEIKRQIKEFKPDVLLGFGIINSYIAARIARKEKIPFIYYWIDVLHRLIPEKSFQALGEYMERTTIKNSTQVITINHKLEEFVRNLGAKNTMVIGAGIDLDKFDPALDGSRIRQEYGIKDGDTILFFMGFLYHFAGLKEVALELAKGKYKNVKLLIVGDGDVYDDLQNIVKEHNLEDKVLLVGRKDYNEIPEYIAVSDICILPAYPNEEIMQDIVPIKIYEYMAMSKPVITTKLPGIIMEFGENNGISYVDLPEDVVSKVIEIDVKAEGKKARKFAEKCDWNEITNEFEDIINKI